MNHRCHHSLSYHLTYLLHLQPVVQPHVSHLQSTPASPSFGLQHLQSASQQEQSPPHPQPGFVQSSMVVCICICIEWCMYSRQGFVYCSSIMEDEMKIVRSLVNRNIIFIEQMEGADIRRREQEHNATHTQYVACWEEIVRLDASNSLTSCGHLEGYLFEL